MHRRVSVTPVALAVSARGGGPLAASPAAAATSTTERKLVLFCLVLVTVGMIAAGCTRDRNTPCGVASCDAAASTDSDVDAATELDANAEGVDGMADEAAVGDGANGDAAASRYCLPSGPTPTVGDRRPELDATPEVKWLKKLTNATEGTASVVMSRQTVAVTVGNSLSLVDKSSGAVSHFVGLPNEMFRGAIVARDDLILVAARNLYAVNPEGELRWSLPLEIGPPILDEWSLCRMTYSSRRAILIAACNDGGMYGVHVGERGEKRWISRLYREGYFNVRLLPSIGEIVLVSVPAGVEAETILAINPETGLAAGTFNTMGEAIWALSSQGHLAKAASTAELVALDSCGRRRWTSQRPAGIRVQVPMIVGLPDERIFFIEREDPSGESQLGLASSADGTRLSGPTGAGTPIAAGADGTFYAVTCDNADPGDMRTLVAPELVAYSEELEEKWRISLPVPLVGGAYACPKASVALDEDGVMYLAVEGDGTYLMAVQTPSPGVAPTLWPLRGGAQNGSNWVD